MFDFRLVLPILASIFVSRVTAQETTFLAYSSQYLDDTANIELLWPETISDTLDILVLLDGDEYSGMAKDVVDLYTFGKKLSPTLIISLPSTQESRWKYYTPSQGVDEQVRETGEFGAYADFIEKDLLPHLSKHFQFNSGRKMIFGHSMGGLAVLSFLTWRPQVFDYYIAASPSTMYDDHFLLKEIESRTRSDFVKIFLSAAESDQNGCRENAVWLQEFLSKGDDIQDRIVLKIYPTENHSTSGLRSLIDGLDFLAK